MKKNNLNSKYLYLLGGFLCCFIACVLLIVFLTRGETAVGGEFPDDYSNDTLACQKDNFDYSFFEYDGSISNTTRVRAVFHGETVRSISLNRTMNYDDTKKAKDESIWNKTAMNVAFSEVGLPVGALSLNFSDNANGYVMSIFANANELSSSTNKFFLLDPHKGDLTINDYKKYYENSGFVCTLNK